MLIEEFVWRFNYTPINVSTTFEKMTDRTFNTCVSHNWIPKDAFKLSQNHYEEAKVLVNMWKDLIVLFVFHLSTAPVFVPYIFPSFC